MSGMMHCHSIGPNGRIHRLMDGCRHPDTSKRFTTAELASEVWRAMYLAEVLVDSKEHKRMMILRRFATLPHHDQETP